MEQSTGHIGKHYTNIIFDSFVIMPNHVHFNIVIQNGVFQNGVIQNGVIQNGVFQNDCRGTSPWVPQNKSDQRDKKGGHGDPSLRLFDIIDRFKSWTTHQYIRGVTGHDWPAFNKRLWQRNYYERILRNDEELRIRQQYIKDNPFQWMDDPYNPTIQIKP